MRGEGLWLAVAAMTDLVEGIRTSGRVLEAPAITVTEMSPVMSVRLTTGRSYVDLGEGMRTVFLHSHPGGLSGLRRVKVGTGEILRA